MNNILKTITYVGLLTASLVGESTHAISGKSQAEKQVITPMDQTRHISLEMGNAPYSTLLNKVSDQLLKLIQRHPHANLAQVNNHMISRFNDVLGGTEIPLRKVLNPQENKEASEIIKEISAQNSPFNVLLDHFSTLKQKYPKGDIAIIKRYCLNGLVHILEGPSYREPSLF